MAIDLETFSKADLAKTGVYRYAEDPSFEVLLFGVSVDGGPVTVYDLKQGDSLPESILSALLDNSIIKTSFNAAFERVCLSRYLWDLNRLEKGEYLDPRGWRCDMVWAGYMGFPMSLKGAGAALGLEERKMEEGKSLITYFCKPYRQTSKNDHGDRNLPHHDPEKWELFKKYNARDVEVELSIAEKLKNHPVPEQVWEEYWLDQEINDRGILIDLPMVEGAITIDEKARANIKRKMQQITGLSNPQSVPQMQRWLKENGVELDSLGKKELVKEIAGIEEPMRSVLLLRQELAMSAVKKYQAMEIAACSDNRCRGMFRFYGANRSGRFSGKIIQLQNLFRNSLPDLEEARALVRAGNYDALSVLYDSVPEVLAQCVRTAFIPAPGYKFIVADFSAIECRVLAWVAGEQWVLDAFANGDDIYCKTASKMFHVPVEKHGINGNLRQRGKQATLSCIAEGQLVLTDQGLVPIQNVSRDMKVWDGEEWVNHDGVVFRGEREVITYEGLTATPDHFVWIEGQSEPIYFGLAAARGSHLIQTGDGGRAVRLGKNHKSGEEVEQNVESMLCTDTMSGMRLDTMADSWKSYKGAFKGLPELYSAETDSKVAGKKIDCSEIAMRELQKPAISELWSEGDQVRFSECDRSRTLFDPGVRSAGQEYGTGSDRQQWELCSRESEVCDEERKQCKQKDNCSQQIRAEVLALCGECSSEETISGINPGADYSGRRECCNRKKEKLALNKRTARLYDIRNAGRHHRFTVSNCLVHNCGYGGSVGALIAMGALDAGMREEELQPLVNAWREANPNIVRLWWAVDRAVRTAVSEHTTTRTHGLTFKYQGGMLYITLPSSRQLCYVRPRMGENRFGGDSVTYMGTDLTKHWSRIETFGGKLVENLVQAISRDILCFAMENLRKYRIVAHVHDEVIIEAPPETTVEEICSIMGQVPPWAPGLILRADGYLCPEFYMKDT